MELKQKTQDKTKAMKEDDAKIQHWSNFHDKLKLHEIEQVQILLVVAFGISCQFQR